MPVILVALAVVALVGGSLQVVILVLGLLMWDRFAVVMRSATQQVRAPRLRRRGAGGRLLDACASSLSEILPNILNALIVVATLEMAHAILLEAALSFLGLGVQPPLPSWGLMIAEAQGLHVLQPLADRHPRRRAVRPGARASTCSATACATSPRRRTASVTRRSARGRRASTSTFRSPSGILHPVRDVSASSVARGETLCIVGESGCGKSLTSLAIMGLLPQRGAAHAPARLAFDGDRPRSALAERDMADVRGNRMAMIFQEPMTSLNPAYTIGNQLDGGAAAPSQAARAARRATRAVYLLEKVGITAAGERLGQYPHQLSGGLRQRVMIAMALMCGPELIIADEPTTALDVTIQAQILHLLADLQREFGMAHDADHPRSRRRRAHRRPGRRDVCRRRSSRPAPATRSFAARCHPYTRGLLRCIPVPGRTAPRRAARLHPRHRAVAGRRACAAAASATAARTHSPPAPAPMSR